MAKSCQQLIKGSNTLRCCTQLQRCFQIHFLPSLLADNLWQPEQRFRGRPAVQRGGEFSISSCHRRGLVETRGHAERHFISGSLSDFPFLGSKGQGELSEEAACTGQGPLSCLHPSFEPLLPKEKRRANNAHVGLLPSKKCVPVKSQMQVRWCVLFPAQRQSLVKRML